MKLEDVEHVAYICTSISTPAEKKPLVLGLHCISSRFGYVIPNLLDAV